MNKNDNFSSIFDNVCTPDDAKNVISDLEALSASLFSSKRGKVVKKIEKILSFELAEGIKRYCKEGKIDVENKEKCQQLVNEIVKALRRLPIITLYLAFLPTELYIKKIAALLHGYCKQKVLIEINVEKIVIGGAVIAWKGMYKDFSLRKTIDETYKDYEYV